MNAESATTVLIAVCGMAASWCVWVSVSVFKHAQEIALIKKEIELMGEIRIVLQDIREQLRDRNDRGK